MRKGISTVIVSSLIIFATLPLSGCDFFIKKVYTVKFYEDVSNTLIDSQQVTKGKEFTYPEVPEITGYTFKSWNTEIQKVYSDMDVIANYTANNYTITLDYNHEGAQNSTINVTYNNQFTLEDAFWEGHTFKGWIDSSGRSWSSGKYAQTSDITLKASWEAIGYSITYHLDDGTNVPTNPTSFTYDDNIALGDASKEGHTFKGWFLDSAFTQKIESITKISRDIDLYAKFDINSYTVKYYANNELVDSETIVYGNKLVFNSIKDINENLNFDGWYLNNQRIDFNTYLVKSDLTLQAKYFANNVYAKTSKSNNKYEIRVGNNSSSIIGLEGYIEFDSRISGLQISEFVDNCECNIVENVLYFNVMFDSNNSQTMDYLKLVSNASSGIENIIVSYGFSCYEKVNGTIQNVEKNISVF